jgi:hypothetical protein
LKGNKGAQSGIENDSGHATLSNPKQAGCDGSKSIHKETHQKEKIKCGFYLNQERG